MKPLVHFVVAIGAKIHIEPFTSADTVIICANSAAVAQW